MASDPSTPHRARSSELIDVANAIVSGVYAGTTPNIRQLARDYLLLRREAEQRAQALKAIDDAMGLYEDMVGCQVGEVPDAQYHTTRHWRLKVKAALHPSPDAPKPEKEQEQLQEENARLVDRIIDCQKHEVQALGAAEQLREALKEIKDECLKSDTGQDWAREVVKRIHRLTDAALSSPDAAKTEQTAPEKDLTRVDRQP